MLNSSTDNLLKSLGKLYQEAKFQDGIESLLKNKDKLSPQEFHYFLGNFYLKMNQFEKAESYYTKAIEINPKRSAKIYKNRAYLKEKQNKNSEAKDDLKNYLKYFPRAPDRGVIEQAVREL